MENPPPANASSATKLPSAPPSVWEIYFPRARDHGSIYVASFPEIIYFWPTILACFLGATFQALGVPQSGVGWFVVLVCAFNFIVLVHDFDQKRFLIFILGLLVLGLLIWIVNLYGFTFLKSLAQWMLSFQPAISTDAYLLFGTLLLILFAWGMVMPLFSYWKLEPNEFVHYSQPVGRDMSIARAGCSVFKEVPDIFECLLTFGGGSLIIRRNETVLATIPHIPFLGYRMAAIEHLLAETRVVVERTES